MELLTSIKGIGVTLAATLIMGTGEFTYFDNAKQLTRYLGLSPTYQQSGTSVNFKGHINRNGDSSSRSQLYVVAFSSLRCNAECRACYDRLQSNGKPGKVAVVAVANKLVRQAFAVVTQERPYVDGYVSTLRSAPLHIILTIKLSKVMLNTELVDRMYAELPNERQQELITLLFKNSKQTMNCFKRTKDISFSKLEILADFFLMPLDYFRSNSSFYAHNIYGSNNNIGNITLSGNLIAENEALRKEVASIKKPLRHTRKPSRPKMT